MSLCVKFQTIPLIDCGALTLWASNSMFSIINTAAFLWHMQTLGRCFFLHVGNPESKLFPFLASWAPLGRISSTRNAGILPGVAKSLLYLCFALLFTTCRVVSKTSAAREISRVSGSACRRNVNTCEEDEAVFRLRTRIHRLKETLDLFFASLDDIVSLEAVKRWWLENDWLITAVSFGLKLHLSSGGFGEMKTQAILGWWMWLEGASWHKLIAWKSVKTVKYPHYISATCSILSINKHSFTIKIMIWILRQWFEF